MSPYDKLMKFLEKNDFITLSEAMDAGVSKMTLSRMVKDGVLHKPAKRIYAKNLDWMGEPLRQYAPACTLYPNAVVCGVSALIYYDLTDEFERKIWLAFPRDHRAINQEYRIVYPRGDSFSMGIVRHKIGKREVRIYDREKSVVDAFKLLPIDASYKVMRAYLKLKNKDMEKLSWYAKKMRKPLDDVMTILLSDE